MMTGRSRARSSSEAEVELARDLQAFFDQDARDDAAFGPGLVRHERHAEHVAGDAAPLRRDSSRA